MTEASDTPPRPDEPAQPDRPANRLAHETSAYLQQHRYNPVDWYPWGPEALLRARTEDKPLLISIGYSACHWCHVMEHESFEDPSTAALMNELFVCIKVDREERPDVDQIYMDTVTGLTGHGGWPLTVFCTPEGKPFHGGTYYPPEPRHGMPSFQQMMQAVIKAYREQREQVNESARQITEALAKRPEGTAESLPGAHTAAQAAIRMLQRADPTNGGFGTAPKFPTPTSLDVLLAGIDALPPGKGQEALDHVLLTCREMARGGLFDHLAGGFHRYSVDAYWRIPHFEKMLYDEGQLIRTYAEALRRSAEPQEDLVWPILETVAFLRNEMHAEEGGWFASLDADSEGEEGKFYVWTPEQIGALLGDAASEFCAAYGVSERGNFEHGTTQLHDKARGPRDEFATERAALLRARAKRIRPGTDRKRVVSWNALTISGLARASSVLGDASLLQDAEAAADFIRSRMRDEQGRLLRVYNEGRAHVLAFLDDHAMLLEACLDLFRAGADPRHLEAACELADAIATRFFEADEQDFYLTPRDGEPLAQRPRSDHDGAMPHSTGLATLTLLRAATLTGHAEWPRIAEGVLRTHAYALERAPEAYPTLARAALAAERGLSVAVVVGARSEERRVLANAARNVLSPEDAVLVASPGEIPAGVDASWFHQRGPVDGKPTVYVCRGVTCSLPITDPDELRGWPKAKSWVPS